MHYIQIGILNKLLFSREARYSDLKVDQKISNNTFQFHLKKVISQGLVKKNDNGLYELTTKGKSMAAYLKTEENRFINLRKISARLFCTRERDGRSQILVYTRLKHPFFGGQGFPSGKIAVGENFSIGAICELKEETNLEGQPILFAITHYIVKDADDEHLLEDKLFMDFWFDDPSGDLKTNNEGKFEWVDLENVSEFIKNPFDSIEAVEDEINRLLKFKQTREIVFNEYTHVSPNF